VIAIDKIFTATGNLSGQAIVHFVRALCAVSLEEIELLPKPRMFSLQKVTTTPCWRCNVCRHTVTPPLCALVLPRDSRWWRLRTTT